MSKEQKLILSTAKDIDSGNTRLDLDQNVKFRLATEDWLAIGDWVAAGERWVFALGVPQSLLKERQPA